MSYIYDIYILCILDQPCYYGTKGPLSIHSFGKWLRHASSAFHGRVKTFSTCGAVCDFDSKLPTVGWWKVMWSPFTQPVTQIDETMMKQMRKNLQVQSIVFHGMTR